MSKAPQPTDEGHHFIEDGLGLEYSHGVGFVIGCSTGQQSDQFRVAFGFLSQQVELVLLVSTMGSGSESTMMPGGGEMWRVSFPDRCP